MKESVINRLNTIRNERENLQITLWGLDAFIKELETALEECSFEEE